MELRGKSVAYLNFDDLALATVNPEEAVKTLLASSPECQHLFFDEIQNVDRWPLLLNQLQRQGHNIVATGSNANLLKADLMTHLTGRYLAFDVLPFSFREYLRATSAASDGGLAGTDESVDRDAALAAFDSFLERGGFPEVVTVPGLKAPSYLSTLWNSILLTDVVNRHETRRSGSVSSLGDWLLSNYGRPTSFRRIAAAVGLKSALTAERYLAWLEEAYLTIGLTAFSGKSGERSRSPRKYFIVDNGLIGTSAVRLSPDRGRLLENMVGTELVKRGFQPNRDLFYFRSADRRNEVDFILRRGPGDLEAIQVSWDLTDRKTERRESAGLAAAVRACNGNCRKLTVITAEGEGEIRVQKQTAKVQPFWKWAISPR